MSTKLPNILPEVEKPTFRLSLKKRLMWTGIAVLIYFILGAIPLYGLDPNFQSRYEMLSVLLAARFGTLLTLGIGPIITGAIMLELLVGAEVIKIDLKTAEGKAKFQSYQKIFSLAFIVIENSAFVLSGALPAAVPTIGIKLLMILQLVSAGIVLMLLDELIGKWGIGSGISLFIAAGVSSQIITRAFQPMPLEMPSGAIPRLIVALATGQTYEAIQPVIALVGTAVVFLLAVYFSCVQVNIPLSLGHVRGFGIKWPIKWFYTSNIPVILTAALIASLQFWAQTLYHAGIPILGTFERVPVENGYVEVPVSGLAKYLKPPTIMQLIQNGVTTDALASIGIYAAMMLTGSVVFAYLWLQVGQLDPSTVADQILSSKLSIPGFRRDKRILERVLSRYILPLTILGGLTVGALAVLADLLDALSRGTGILLTVMIIYRLYETIQRMQLEEIPLFRKVFG